MPTLIKADQRTPEWFQARLGRPTASRFGDIMAMTRSGQAASRKNYRTQLALERISGVKTESFTSQAMQDGIDYEPVARLAYELETGNEVVETGFWLLDDMDAGASPDGLVGLDGCLEIKNPLPANHLETLRTGKIPRQHIAQVQGQMWVANKQWCDFVSYSKDMPENARLFITRVPRDEEYIQRLEKEIKQFLREVEDEVEFVTNYRSSNG